MTVTSELRQSGRALEFFDNEGLSRLIGLPALSRAVEFITKECVDNALDKLDTHNILIGMLKNKQEGLERFELSITDDGKGGFGKLFENSNDVDSARNNKLLDFDKSISSKRGLKVVSRGILGYALQSCIGLSRVAWHGYERSPDYTVIIETEGKKHSIKAIRNQDSILKDIRAESSALPKRFTRITFILPEWYYKETSQADFVLRHLSWVNPQVQFLLFDNESVLALRCGHYHALTKNVKGTGSFDNDTSSSHLDDRVLNLLRLATKKKEKTANANDQNISARDPLVKWKRGRAGSLHCYSEDEFVNLLDEYAKLNPPPPIFDFISMFDGFRGKTDAQELLRSEQIDAEENVSELSSEKAKQLFQAGKCSSRALEETDLPLLGKRYFAEIFGSKFSRYRAIRGMRLGPEGERTPWAIELVSLHTETTPELYEFVNYSFSGSKHPFSGVSYHLTKDGTNSTGEKVVSLAILVQKAEQSLLIHGVSPAFQYRDTGKGVLETVFFSDALPEAVQSILRKESKRGGHGNTQVDILRRILMERVGAVRKNPEVVRFNRWTQSTVYYLARKKAASLGISITRESFTSAIRDECKKLGYKRHQLGIIAADRAQLYFRGKWSDVGFEEVRQLAEKGTDLLFIEKEGVAEILAPMDKEGIALLNSRGFAVEYAQDLLELANTKGCNLAVITDMDASGYLMTQNVMQNSIPRIAITSDTLSGLGIDKSAVEEPYKPHANHYKPLADTLAEADPETYRYIATKRIEIDSVLAAVGPEKFWKHILNKLSTLYPTRDYRRALRADTQSIIEDKYKDLLKPLIEAAEKKTEKVSDSFLEDKSSVSGFLDVEEVENRFREEIENKLDSDEELKGVEEAIRDTLKKKLSEAGKTAKS